MLLGLVVVELAVADAVTFPNTLPVAVTVAVTVTDTITDAALAAPPRIRGLAVGAALAVGRAGGDRMVVLPERAVAHDALALIVDQRGVAGPAVAPRRRPYLGPVRLCPLVQRG